MTRLAAVTFALTCLLCLSSAQSDGELSDRSALLALKDSANSYGRSKMASWGPEGLPCEPGARWRHVTCAQGRVTGISLANLGVVGTLPADLWEASELTTLNLSGNRFTGGIPDEWAGKVKLARLRRMDLSNNDLSGKLPNWNHDGAWRSLAYVDLSGNNFYGGLPSSWLGKFRAIDTVEFLDLSNNFLGQDADGNPLPREAWCPSEAAAGMGPGAGFCPTAAPLAGTAKAMKELNLANNGLSGLVPEQWPRIFTKLTTLKLQLNDLHQTGPGGAPVPAALPGAWTSESKRGFPALSALVLYPGNEYLCSMIDVDGSFKDVNLDATYQILDDSEEPQSFGDDNPVVCPAGQHDDNPPASVAWSGKGGLTWSFDEQAEAPVWGFKVSMSAYDAEGEYWTTWEGGWVSIYLRSYTLGDDGFGAADVAAQGLTCTSGSCTLDFAQIATERLSAPDLDVPPSVISKFKVEVSVYNMDGVESSKRSAILNNA